jgi:hypothetical protein
MHPASASHWTEKNIAVNCSKRPDRKKWRSHAVDAIRPVQNSQTTGPPQKLFSRAHPSRLPRNPDLAGNGSGITRVFGESGRKIWFPSRSLCRRRMQLVEGG